MNAKSLGLISVVCTLLGGAAFGGGTWYWAGTADGRWDNPANWRVDAGGTLVVATDCPGIITNELDVISNNQPGATAVFGAVAAGAATTIDTTHLKSIYAVKVRGADAPSYQFGTGNKQPLFCEPAVDGVRSSFTVEAGVQTKQTIMAIIGTGTSGTQNPYEVRNDGSEELNLGPHWGTTKDNQEFYVYGSGPIAYCGASTGWTLHMNFLNSGEIRFPSKVTANFKGFYFDAAPVGVTKKVVIPANCTGLRVNEGGSGIKTMYNASCNVLVTGDETGVGTIDLYGCGADAFQFAVADGKTLRLEVPVKIYDARYNNLFIFGPGRTELAAANANSGPLDLSGKAVVAVEKIGNKGCAVADSNIGTGSVIRYGRMFSSTRPAEGTLEYIGAGESFDRDIAITNAAVARVRNAGTGTLTLTGTAELAPDSASGVLAFDAATAPIVFSGSLAGTNMKPTLRIEGASTVTLDAVPESVQVEMAGGTLTFGDAVVPSIGRLAAVDGVGFVAVPEGKTLTVASFSAAGGATVDFRVPDGAQVSFPNAPVGRLAGVRLNGAYALVDENHLLQPHKTTWKSADDGRWSDADRWSQGVPEEDGMAEVTASGAADYTVHVDAPLTTPDTLTIGTESDASTAVVETTVPVSFVDRAVNLVRGGELRVKSGIDFKPTAAGAVNLGGAPAVLSLAEGAMLTVDSGRSVLSARANEFKLNGGTLVLTNDAFVSVGGARMFGSGEIVMSGKSVVSNTSDVSPTPYAISPDAPGESVHVVVRDGSYFDLRERELKLCDNVPQGRVTVDVVGTGADGTNAVFTGFNDGVDRARIYNCIVGYRAGTAVLNVSNGYVRPGNYGLHIASTYSASIRAPESARHFPTGVVNLVAGKVSTSGYGHPYAAIPCGLIVGDGAMCRESPGSHCCGWLTIAGGELHSTPGDCMIGVGAAEGHVVQTGGTFSHYNTMTAAAGQEKPDGSSVYYCPMIIGAAGGEGDYVLSNGTAKCEKPLFVGGCPSNRLELSVCAPFDAKHFPYDRHDARGTLEICGGSFKMTSTNEVVVGADGSGTLAFEPAWRDADGALVKGLFQADTVVLSNQTDSTLRFTLGDEGTAFLNVTNRLVVTDAAKLVIDARGVTGRLSAYTKLASVNVFEGTFDPANIEIAVPAHMEQEGNVAVFERNGEKGIWLRRAPQGTMIFIR